MYMLISTYLFIMPLKSIFKNFYLSLCHICFNNCFNTERKDNKYIQHSFRVKKFLLKNIKH